MLVSGLLVAFAMLLTLGLHVIDMAGRRSRTQAAGDGSTVTMTVDARQGWQASGLQVQRGAQIKVIVTGGQWTQQQGRAPYNAGTGTGYICGEAMPPERCVEYLPMFPQGGLIGQIGGQIFGVGARSSVVADQAGMLYLRINDADSALSDNDGTLTVQITASH